jgi:hypothetical protein
MVKKKIGFIVIVIDPAGTSTLTLFLSWTALSEQKFTKMIMLSMKLDSAGTPKSFSDVKADD